MNEVDFVAQYAQAQGLVIRSRTVLVEGTSDVGLFEFAAMLELEETGVRLIDGDLAIVAAGEGDRGGCAGVVRQLITLRNMGQVCLTRDGRPRYRFVGLFDNDDPGRSATSMAKNIDTSILEYRDIFRLRPSMPTAGALDPRSLEDAFNRANATYKTLKWELEDLLGDALFDGFLAACPTALKQRITMGGKTHRELTKQGKTCLHDYTRTNAARGDVQGVIEVLRSLRVYLGLASPIRNPPS